MIEIVTPGMRLDAHCLNNNKNYVRTIPLNERAIMPYVRNKVNAGGRHPFNIITMETLYDT